MHGNMENNINRTVKKISKSDLGKFNHCPYMFRLKVILGIRVEFVQNEAARIGSEYHNTFADFFDNYPYDYLKKAENKMSFKDIAVQRFYEAEKQRAMTLDWKHYFPIREVYLWTKTGEHGFIDRVNIFPDGTAIIIEYKPKYKKSVLDELAFYTHLLENAINIKGEPIRVTKWGGYFYKTKQHKIWHVDRDLVEKVLEQVRLLRRDLTAPNAFRMKNRSWCKWCDYTKPCTEVELGIMTESMLVEEQTIKDNLYPRDKKDYVKPSIVEVNKNVFKAHQRILEIPIRSKN